MEEGVVNLMNSSYQSGIGGEVSQQNSEPKGYPTHHRTPLILVHPNQNCKSWIRHSFEDYSLDLCECPSCAACGKFSWKKTTMRWMWDVTLPDNWSFGDYEAIRLVPVQVPIYTITCIVCDVSCILLPSFVLPGTRLTVTAVAVVALLYEATTISLRAMAEKLCDPFECIAHSTLFRALRGLGQSLQVQEVMGQLMAAGAAEEETGWGPAKARLPHTVKEESAVRKLLTPLWRHYVLQTRFHQRLLRYLDGLYTLFHTLHIAVSRIYPRCKE